ncbi:MAG: ATP-binding cassette domain-containing protein [Clostridiales bacterium]|jgi:peptide/nickel transport system ATP-binding protein/oligopeptide transport system ATP-binding protein|nr:ATP-binding cassette domain-containing protein [Clostridiales bacterium]MDR2751859.1 ATP-binding cassette domain-containing protein [Clostridiales bacterium]
MGEKVVLEALGVSKFFYARTKKDGKRQVVKAVDNVSFKVRENETFSLVGESGCGKSTTGRTVMRLLEPTEGKVLFMGENIMDRKGASLKQLRRQMQMIFQDPYSSLNPRKAIGRIIEEPLEIHHIGNASERREMAISALKQVGLREDQFYRYPHEFSGGQKQRIGIARALILEPKILVCDEPVSALDVSIQSQVLNLLQEIKDSSGVSLLFISHNMSVIRYISDRVGVMYLGRIVEECETARLFRRPGHPYTKALLSAVPEPSPNLRTERVELQGEVPSPLDPPSGCAFHNRCAYATPLCSAKIPERQEVETEHYVECHYAKELLRVSQQSHVLAQPAVMGRR